MDYIEYTDNNKNEESKSLTKSYEDSLLEKSEELTELDDSTLTKMYNYYIYGGYYNILSIQIVNILSTIFLVFLLLILCVCIDYDGIANIKNNEEYIWKYIDFRKIYLNSFFNIVTLIIFFVYILFRFMGILDDTQKYYKIRKIYKSILGIKTKDLYSNKWSEIVDKISENYGKEYNIYTVNSKILRKDNLMISLLSTNLSNFIFCKLMEWNITYCIVNNILTFCENNENIDLRKKGNTIIFKNRNRLKKKILNTLLTLSVLTYLFMPILVVYVFFFSLLKYGEKYYNNPSKITYRQWSLGSKWKLKYYNELKHDYQDRMNISSKYAKDYLSQFSSRVNETIIRFIIFIFSSIFIVFLFLSLYNEHILLSLNVTKSRPVLWYMGIFGSIIAIGRSINTASKIDKLDRVDKYKSLLCYNKFIYFNVAEDNDFLKQSNLKKYYEYQLVTLLKECFSVVLVPFFLIYLANYIDSIIEVAENNIIIDSKLGFIAKNSDFRSLNKKSQPKSLISFNEFRKKYKEWGANIEVYQIGRLESLDEVNILNELNINENNEVNDYNKSIFDMTLNSDISII